MTGKINFLSGKHKITGNNNKNIDENRYLKKLRKSGEESLNLTHFADTFGEKWKYTDIKPIVDQNFNLAKPVFSVDKRNSALMALLHKKTDGVHIVLVDGYFSKELSDLKNIPDGLTITGFNYGRNNIQDIELIGSVALLKNNSFISLNTSLFEDYIMISTNKRGKVKAPVHITLLSTGEKEPQISSPRIFIHTAEGSEVDIVEEYTGVQDSVYLTNSVTEILMEKGSTLNHHKIQRESRTAFHIGFLYINQKKGSSFNSYLSSFGGKISRNEINSSINGEQAESHMNGIYLLNGDQHIDNHTEIYHLSPESTSSEKYHGILDDDSKAVFDGLIYVAKGAVKTDSSQSNKSLLLSNRATVNSKPALEIYADDVKCSHNATVGQMDEESVYYLRSRGIDKKDAVRILTSGFANEIIDQFKIESARERVAVILSDKLSEI